MTTHQEFAAMATLALHARLTGPAYFAARQALELWVKQWMDAKGLPPMRSHDPTLPYSSEQLDLPIELLTPIRMHLGNHTAGRYPGIELERTDLDEAMTLYQRCIQWEEGKKERP